MLAVPVPSTKRSGGGDRRWTVAVDALAARFGGTAYAALQLTDALARRDDVAGVHLVAQRDSLIGQAVRPAERVHPVLLVSPRRGELAWRVAYESARLPGLVGRRRADVLLTLSGMLPRRPAAPVVSLLANPVPFVDGGVANRLRRAAMHRTKRYALATYVPSTQMQEMVGGPRTRVVPLGVDFERFRPGDGPGSELLYVADFYAHKRHDLLVAAWERLSEPRPRLRLVGNPAVDPATFAAVQRLAHDPRVVVAGRVSFVELLRAFAGARALVVPSERESFCMPLAEGAACGIPAVVADHPVLRETAGPGALVVPEATAEAWASALQRILSDDALHAELRMAALDHARRFSWDAMAAEVVRDCASRR